MMNGLALVALLAAPAFAVESPPLELADSVEVPPSNEPVEPAVATAGLAITHDLRGEYLRGESIVVRVVLENRGATPMIVPDLSKRPWLVRFGVERPSGEREVRYTTPPPEDRPETWTLQPMGKREVLLEIPSSGAFTAGLHKISFEVHLDGEILPIDGVEANITSASPVAGDLRGMPAWGLERVGHRVGWLHQSAGGYDLYMTRANGVEPVSHGRNTFLARFDSSFEPHTSLPQLQRGLEPFIYWASGDRGIEVLKLDGSEVSTSRVELPYPRFELVGRGTTDSSGAHNIPVWIPAPSGSAGELRVVVIDHGRIKSVSSVSRYPARPAWIESATDSVGSTRLLVGHRGGVDHYSLIAGGSELPARGRRVATGNNPNRRATLAISTHEGNEGLSALFATIVPSEAVSQIEVAWSTLDGSAIGEPRSFDLGEHGAALTQLVAIHPGPEGAWAVEFISGGEAKLLLSTGDVALPPAGTTPFWGAEGGLYARKLTGENGPLSIQRVR